MFYRPADGHGLRHNPFNAIVTPRPIGWISTRGSDGSENLAPYSFFNAVAYVPPQVMFASTGTKADRDGSRVIAAGKPEASELVARIESDDPDLRMPPADSGRRLTDRERKVLRQWIAEGAAWHMDHRFRVRPGFRITDRVAVFTQVDLLPYVQWGTQPVAVADPFTGENQPVVSDQRST